MCMWQALQQADACSWLLCFLQELRATGKPVSGRPFVSSASPTRAFTPDTKLYSCLSPPPGG
jgi:hypothetical protein